METVKDWRVGKKDSGGPIAADFSSDSDVLLMAFGGLKRGIGRIHPFEFFNLTRGVDCKKIYVRDMDQAWYHRGLPGIGGDVNGTALYLMDLIHDSGARRVVVVGNSAGGYAALLFGFLIVADVVHAFSPQTFIDKANRKSRGDHRWEGAQIRNAHNSPTRREEYFDLKRVLGGRTMYHIHYQRRSKLDQIHAERMRAISANIALHLYGEGGGDHQLVVYLKESGALKRLLLRELE